MVRRGRRRGIVASPRWPPRRIWQRGGLSPTLLAKAVATVKAMERVARKIPKTRVGMISPAQAAANRRLVTNMRQRWKKMLGVK